MDEGLQITVDEVREHNAKILQLIDLQILLPLLKDKGVLTEEVTRKVSDSKHYGQFERSNFLLNFLYQRGQEAIDAFIDCLRQGNSPNHAQILQLLEGESSDTQSESPLFEILDSQLEVIAKHVNLVPLLKSLMTVNTIQLNTFVDLQNTDRTLKETLERLFTALKKQGSRGFISFLSCLQMDLPNPGHEKLSEILFEEVNRFFREHPQRDKVGQSDRIEVLQLVKREKIVGQEIHQRIIKHRQTLVAQINVPSLLPSLLKYQVVTRQELDYLSQLDRSRQSEQLLDLLLNKELGLMIKFVECLKQTPLNRESGELLLPSAHAPGNVMKSPDQVLEKYDKMAVFVYAESYFSPNGVPSSSLEPRPFDQPIKEHRDTLKRQLQNMDFNIVTLETSIDADDPTESTDTARGNGGQRSKYVNVRFEREVAKQCNEGAVVFVFLSGIQYPCKMGNHEYNGAVLRSNASKIGRLPLDSIESEDLSHWVGMLPNAHVTFLIDTDPSHVVAYDKIQQASKVEIMDDPWSGLLSLDSSTVVIFLKPDPQAIAKNRGRGLESPLGMLTETFVKALVSCVLKNKEEVSHRSLYEAISFYWHSCDSGRLHVLYEPAMGGDVDRCFLGTSAVPFQQAFRADLKRKEPGDGDKEIFQNEIKIPTGTMAGFIQNDQLEIFHVLRPGVRVSGHITDAYQLHSLAEVDKGEEWSRLCEVLYELYQDENLKKESSQFLFVRKKVPFHQRLTVFPQELGRSDTNTLKTYIKERSHLLSSVTNEKEAKVVVSYDGQHYHVEDKGKDIKYPIETKSVQRVKSMLEVLAWFKYVKSLKSRHKTTFAHECFLTAAHPLLSAAAPTCFGFDFSWSSWVDIDPRTLGYEAILNFSESPQYWTPAAADTSPYFAVQFKKNRVLTAIEFKSDSTHHSFVKEAKLLCKKNVEERVVRSSDQRVEFAHEEAVQSVVIKPRLTGVPSNFSIAMKIKAKLPGPKSKSVRYLDQVWVHDHNLVTQFGWTFTPSFDQLGQIMLDPATHQLTWTGVSDQELILNLPLEIKVVESIEFLDHSGLEEFTVTLKTPFFEIPLSPFESPYPQPYYFPRPLVASTVMVFPLKVARSLITQPPPISPNAGNIKLQLQLHGNVHGEPLEVDEGDIITFQLNSLGDKQLYYYILCLEETGDITIINEGENEAPKPSDSNGKRIFPPAKQLLETVIPEDYEPKLGYIQDEYRVWISPTKLYMEPFCQKGVHCYHDSICYNVCTQGHRSHEEINELYDHHFAVKIKIH